MKYEKPISFQPFDTRASALMARKIQSRAFETAAPGLDYSQYPQTATTELVANVQDVQDEVRRRGALILTRYNSPSWC